MEISSCCLLYALSLKYTYFLLQGLQPELEAVHAKLKVIKQYTKGNEKYYDRTITNLNINFNATTTNFYDLVQAHVSLPKYTCVYRPELTKDLEYGSSIKCIFTKHSVYVYYVMKMVICGIQHQSARLVPRQQCILVSKLLSTIPLYVSIDCKI